MANHKQHEKILSKFRECDPIPKGYYETPNPYKDQPLSQYNLRAMLSYAEKSGKDPANLTRQDLERFRV